MLVRGVRRRRGHRLNAGDSERPHWEAPGEANKRHAAWSTAGLARSDTMVCRGREPPPFPELPVPPGNRRSLAGRTPDNPRDRRERCSSPSHTERAVLSGDHRNTGLEGGRLMRRAGGRGRGVSVAGGGGGRDLGRAETLSGYTASPPAGPSECIHLRVRGWMCWSRAEVAAEVGAATGAERARGDLARAVGLHERGAST